MAIVVATGFNRRLAHLGHAQHESVRRLRDLDGVGCSAAVGAVLGRPGTTGRWRAGGGSGFRWCAPSRPSSPGR
jgi:hypothetical protein